MENNALVIVALVGLALMCVGLLALTALLGLRYLSGRLRDEPASPADILRRAPRNRVTARPDLRAIARAQDFDAAVARKGAAPQNTAPRVGQPGEPPFPDATPTLGSRRPRRVPNRSDEDEDDALADFTDDL